MTSAHAQQAAGDVQELERVSESFHRGVLNQLLRIVGSDLKALGFSKRGGTFNRVTDECLTQVINLQAGRFDPPGALTIPGYRENVYGRFTVNLGVYVPEVGLYTTPASAFVTEAYCCIRSRLGYLGPEGADLWWNIDADPRVTDDVRHRMQAHGIPFLERFGTRNGILSEWDDSICTWSAGGRPPRIVKAIILAARGDVAEASALLSEQANTTEIASHADTYAIWRKSSESRRPASRCANQRSPRPRADDGEPPLARVSVSNRGANSASASC
jgi:hypothetical protein